MAWSEGFATWNSSDTRNSSLYFDKQQGSLFWLDIAARNHASGMAWTRPTAAAGLQQLLDENEVSAMIWHLTAGNSAASASVLAALASPKMTASPFVGRGYTQHTWTLQGTPPTISNVVDKGIPIPTVADLFDALVCGGFPPSAIDAATEPTVHYPYPSASPLCTSTCGTCAGCCSGGACQPGTTNAACGLGGSACVACGAGQTCTNGACTGGTACNAASCPNSCCAGNVCVPPSAGQCGAGGSICSACPAGAACDNGQCRRGLGQACGPSALCGSTLACAEQPIGSGAGFCRATCPSGAGCAAGFNCVTLASNKYCVPAPTASSQWKVVFYSADIKSTDSSGAAWDVGGGSPDPYLCATVGTAAGVCSTFKADTLTPLWNEQTSGAYSFGSLASTTLSLYDDDIAADDFIDSYVVDLRPPWAGQIWAYSFSHAADPSKRSNTVVVALVPQ